MRMHGARLARSLTIGTFLLAAAPALAAGITDYRSLKPGSITLPAAGGKYVDPRFGTTIIRATDSRDGTRCTHGYSYWPAFNYDHTRLMLSCDDRILLYTFDASTDTLTHDGTLYGSDGYKLQFEGATWSTTSPSKVYALDKAGTRLWKVNVATRGLAGYTLLKDFAYKFPGKVLYQLMVSDDADVFSFQTRDPSTGAHLDAVIWVRSTNKVYVFPRNGAVIDESKVDKLGRLGMINWKAGGVTIWDFRNGSYKKYSASDATADVSGHFDMGEDFIANSDAWHTGIVVRTFGSLGTADNIVQYKRPDGSLNWSLCDHVSLRSAIEEYVAVSTYAGDGSWAAFEDEIFLVRTDGNGFVRLAHSRSQEVNSNSSLRYYAQPRAVVDRSGRYIVYTSDLGSTTRFDVMILKVPSAYWPS